MGRREEREEKSVIASAGEGEGGRNREDVKRRGWRAEGPVTSCGGEKSFLKKFLIRFKPD